MIKNFYNKNKLKTKFLVAGGINTLFGLGLFPLVYILFKSYNFHYLIILCISQSICIIFSYMTNKFFVFQTKGNYLNEFFKFSSFYVIYFLLNLFTLPIMVELLKMGPILSQALFSILIIVSSFFWHSKLSFSKN